MIGERLRVAWRQVCVLAALALACALTLGIVYWATVRTVRGRVLGDASLRGALGTGSALEGTVTAVLDVISVASLLGAVAVVAVIALVRLDRIMGLAAITVLIGANGSTWLLKNVLLTRPDLGLSEIAPATLNSLPSGHSTAAFSAVAALLFVLPRRWRLPTATLGMVYASLTALATMSAGWHRAADSVSAFTVVGAWSCLAAIGVLAAGRRSDPAGADPGRTPVRWPLAGAVGTVALGAILTMGLSAADSFSTTSVGGWLAFGAGGLFTVGTAVAVTAGILVALDLAESAPVPEPGPSAV